MKHVFFAGGTGFLGQQVVREFLKHGYRVSLLAHRNLPDEFRHSCNDYRGNITQFRWDKLETDMPDAIIHLARIPGRFLPGRLTGGLQGRRANQKLINWLKSLEKPPLLLFCSGTLVYGSRGSQKIDEHSRMQPISFQKYYSLAETPVLQELRSPLPIRIIRPPWVFGNGSWFSAFYLKPMQESGFVPIYGSGNQYMSLISLSDFADTTGIITEAKTGNDIFNTVRNQPIQHKQFAELLSEISGLPVKNITERHLRRKYGKTVADALTHSLYVQSKHFDLYSITENTTDKLKLELDPLLRSVIIPVKPKQF